MNDKPFFESETMSKHTPGPWSREGNTIYALMHDCWRNGVEQMRNRFTVFVQKDQEISDEEQEANARLIAAAPDLLDSLKALLDWYNCKITPPEEYFDSVRAAIAKAEGTE